jgi:hypothetical protein
MAGRWLGITTVVLALTTLSGCASWCARNYPCQAPAAYAAPACCCPAPVAAAPVCQPVTGYASPSAWQQPTANPCACR